MKYKRGDLVGQLSAGGFGSMSQGARPAVVIDVLDGEYELYLPGLCPDRATAPENFVAELSAENRGRLLSKSNELLAKLEKFNLKEWDPMFEVREALKMAVAK